ncbi:hypothetical protein C5167_021727 [Papaver somniferum]|uniref:Uncharacterized protein n=2 Tax=Papaver somniferum TaxID=3469 RepID=A0A4Y7JGT4_PAPSO|nr:hypothetical protein C5167_021727 [Papaver somniferum]
MTSIKKDPFLKPILEDQGSAWYLVSSDPHGIWCCLNPMVLTRGIWCRMNTTEREVVSIGAV